VVPGWDTEMSEVLNAVPRAGSDNSYSSNSTAEGRGSIKGRGNWWNRVTDLVSPSWR